MPWDIISQNCTPSCASKIGSPLKSIGCGLASILLCYSTMIPTMSIENFNEILDSLLIAPWEAILYGILASAYILIGLYKSYLIVTFAFTSYWGFKNLLKILSLSEGTSDGLIILYVLSGLAILGLIILNYLSKQLRQA